MTSTSQQLSVRLAAGPTTNYVGRPGLGYEGTRCRRFDGTAGATGLQRVVLRECDELITEDTELSYVLCYEVDEGLRYAGGFVALDLVFADGTRLSDLGGTDQLGVPLTAAAQGRSKAAYPQQWNLRRCRAGLWAAGRRAVAIELAWEPVDDLAVTGWVDRIRLGATPAPGPRRPCEHVLTTRGTNSNGRFSRGNNLPATAMPNGFALFTPCTDARSLRWVYSWADHNDERNRPRLQALSVSHQPSPWMGDRLTFQVMPQSTSQPPTAEPTARSLGFDHDHELARPHHYRVELDGGLVAEIAPADHGAVFACTFPTGAGRLIFDQATGDGQCRLSPDGSVTATSAGSPDPGAGSGTMYVSGYCTPAPRATGGLDDGAGPSTAAYADFGDPDADGPLRVEFRFGTSFLDHDLAAHSRTLELGPRGAEVAFDALVARAADAWDARLGVLEISGAGVDDPALGDEARTTVSSHLYRLNLYPNAAHENRGTADEPQWVHAAPGLPGCPERAGRLYVNHGFWDTYRTAWPLYALLYPTLCGDLIDGFVQHYRDGGWIPRWSSPGYADCMVGTSSDVAFADAYRKGVPMDAETAYLAALRNASAAAPDPRMGRKSLDRSAFLGYTPAEEHEGMSWSMDGYINDAALAGMARSLGHQVEADWLSGRAADYTRLFHPGRKFFCGRRADGTWRLDDTEFDPDDWGEDYTETNAWTMRFTVPHDGAGLAALYGGEAGLADALQSYLDRPETGLATGAYGHLIHEMIEARDVRMGMYGHSNQPAHHIPFLWLHAGRPDRCQEMVREIMSRFHAGSEIGQGYGGDEDNGEMSAWHLFAALGVYPLTVGEPHYVLGSPLYGEVRIRRADGTTLQITAADNAPDHPYVAGVQVDGAPHDRCWIRHDELLRAETITWQMSAHPQPWGRDSRPPSLTGPGDAPRTREDVTRGARLTGPDGLDVAPLVDDWSGSAVELPAGAEVVIEHAEPVMITMYTLTAPMSGDPTNAWRLEAEVDGAWQPLDERHDEGFRWPGQTRPFRPAGSATTHRHRLTTLRPGALAELELLADSGVGSVSPTTLAEPPRQAQGRQSKR